MTFLSVTAIFLGIAFAVFILIKGRGQGVRGWVLAPALGAVVAVEICDLMALLRPEEWVAWKQGALVAESLLPGLWLLFALTFAREGRLRELPFMPLVLLVVSPLFLLAVLFTPFDSFLFSPDFGEERLLFLGRAGYFFSIGLLLYLVYILMQLERTLVSTPRHARWRGKFELIGAGTLLVMLLLYYSQGLLHKTIDMHLLPARSLALSAAVLMMAWSRLRRGEAMAIRVSREMAFRSVVVLSVGVYLLSLGLLGEGMRYLGDAQRRSILIVTGLAGGLGMVIVFLSEIARRKIRVFLHKSFYREKYDYRDQWQRFTRKLSASESQSELYRAILLFYAETFAVQGAALFLRDTENGIYRPVSIHGFEKVNETFTTENTLVRSFGEEGWIFSSRDEHPEIRRENRDFLQAHRVSFVVPLRFDRNLEGFIVLGRVINDAEEYTFEDFDLMKMLALQATSTILSMNLTEQLAQAREMAAIGKVSAFVLHDLKNLVSNLALVVDTARDNIADPEYQEDMLQTLTVTVHKMKAFMSRLKKMEEKAELDPRVCDLKETIREGLQAIGGTQVTVQGDRATSRIDPVEIQKVAINLVLNAIESGPEQSVRVETGETAGRAFFRVRDEGCGMTEEFIRTRLFRPFETTKTKGFGIGLYQCKTIVEAHGGTIEVRSRAGEGTEFTVWLPRSSIQEPEKQNPGARSRRSRIQEPESRSQCLPAEASAKAGAGIQEPGVERQKLTSPDAA
jgi:putative PEP-CTERM system histidine kinase